MKIAVIIEDSQTISQHFGRAPYYEIAGKEPRGHGFGTPSDARRARLIEAIQNHEAIITRGMEHGVYLAMEQTHIRPFVTDLADAERAVKAYMGSTPEDHAGQIHRYGLL